MFGIFSHKSHGKEVPKVPVSVTESLVSMSLSHKKRESVAIRVDF